MASLPYYRRAQYGFEYGARSTVNISGASDARGPEVFSPVFWAQLPLCDVLPGLPRDLASHGWQHPLTCSFMGCYFDMAASTGGHRLAPRSQSLDEVLFIFQGRFYGGPR